MLTRWFCFRLNTAAVIIGWLGGLLSLFGIIVFGFCLGYIDDIVNEIIKTAGKENEAAIHKELTITFVTLLVSNSINLLTSFCLVLGAVKERHLLLLPWLINSAISLLLYGIYFVLVIIAAANAWSDSTVQLIVLISLSLAYQGYMWSAMYSLFKNLQHNADQQQPLRTTASAYPSYTQI